MINIDKIKNDNNSERAPRNREAPLPLIGPTKRRRAPTAPASSKINEIFKDHPGLGFTQNTGFQGGPSRRRKGYRLALWSWLASFIDALLLFAASCAFIISFSLILNTSAGHVLNSIFHTQQRLLFFAEVFAVASWVYLISIRVFMGSSIGEWACDIRLGTPYERLAASYVLRVLMRSSLILFTGVLTLPILSLLFGRDLAGMICGLRLFSLK